MITQYTKRLFTAALVLLLSTNSFADTPPVSDTLKTSHANEEPTTKRQKIKRQSDINEVDPELGVVLPKFQGGGTDKFSKWFAREIIYPEAAKRNNIEGNVKVKFTIDEDGNLCDIEILFSSAQCFSDEVLRVLNKSPKWTPASYLNGETISFTYSLPFGFNLRRKSEIPYGQQITNKNREFPGLDNDNTPDTKSIVRITRRY